MSIDELKQASELPPLLTVPQLAKFLNVGRNAAYEQCHRNGFPVIRIGRQLRIPRDALLRWLDRQADANTAPTPLRRST